MANTATLHRAFLSLAQQWPKDPIRPNLQFSYALEAAAARIFLTSPSPSSSTTASPAAGSSSSEAVLKVLSPADLSRAQMSIESLERLLDNKAKKAVRPSHSLLLSSPRADQLLTHAERTLNSTLSRP